MQPILYAQLSNLEFVAESISLVGGLLMLRAHLISEQAKSAGDGAVATSAARAAIARTQLLGRLLLPAVYLYHAGPLLLAVVRPEPTDSIAMFVASLSAFVIGAAVLVGLVLGAALVAAGLKSRTVALSLALLNLAFVCYQYPFARYVWFAAGEWQFDEVNLRNHVPHVALAKGVTDAVFDPSQIYDLHKYYFFQGLSTSGALLLLAQFGPGEIAVQEDEVLLGDVQKARDYRVVPSS